MDVISKSANEIFSEQYTARVPISFHLPTTFSVSIPDSVAPLYFLLATQYTIISIISYKHYIVFL